LNYNYIYLLRRLHCQEEIEQAQGVKALELVGVWDKAAGAVVEVAGVAAVLVETVFARTAVKVCPISRENPALRKNVPSAGRQ
jgi:hypothetical protein